MRFEAAFEKAFGRTPTAAELDRFRRVSDAFEVRDNDALMAIAGLLQFYDGSFRENLQTSSATSREMVAVASATICQTLDHWLSTKGRLVAEAIDRKIDQRLEMGAATFSATALRALQQAIPVRAPMPTPARLQLSAVECVMLFALFVLNTVFVGCSHLLIGGVWAWKPSLFRSSIEPVLWFLGSDVVVLAGACWWWRRRA
jgi:hypothetical protein